MDVLTFGETMVAFSTSKNDSIVRSNHTNATIAGAESNVAIALARLGHDVKWFSRLGADPFGEKILYELNAEGIDTKDVIIDFENATGLMYKQKNGLLDSEVIYYRNQSAATRMSIDDIQPEWIKKATIIHLTGITPSISDSCKQMVFEVLSLAKQHNKLISFDPNVRLKLWDIEKAKEVLLPIIKICDFFFPGRNEMELLFGVNSIDEISKVLKELEVPLTVLKDGAKGAWLIEQNDCLFIPSFHVDYIADEIGAGDAFAAGFLHGYLQGNGDKETCVKLGHTLAAFVISVEGDTQGLPTKRELERFWDKDLTTIR